MTDTVKTFADFDVDPRICEALERRGITTPFPIQELTLPLALSGADLIGQARTGTGKTLAFGLPLLQRVDTASNTTQALVIVPTRELCLQVHDDLEAAGSLKGATVVAAYGGRAIDPQSEAIARGAEIVVGTPGRLLDLMRRGLLNLSTVRNLVLDEADEMLDMGFLPDVEQLIEACGEDRQTLLFSATMPSEVVALARRYMNKPTFMRADVEESRIVPTTRQHFFAVHRMDKPAVVARILATPQRGRCVIFTRTKRMADMLVKDLRDANLNAAAIHSDLRQEAREKTLARFRTGKVDVMCATEVAARGLDIDEVTHVINYDCPDDEKMYLHRIGRTGRAGAKGVAITLAIWNEMARLDMIKKALDITEPTHEVFSTSALLDELFPLAPPAPPADAEERAAAPARRRGTREETRRGDAREGGRRDRREDATAGASGPRGGASAERGEPGATPRRRVRRRSRSAGAGPDGTPAASTPERVESADRVVDRATSDDARQQAAVAAESRGPVDGDTTADGRTVRRRVRRRSASGEHRTRPARTDVDASPAAAGTSAGPDDQTGNAPAKRGPSKDAPARKRAPSAAGAAKEAATGDAADDNRRRPTGSRRGRRDTGRRRSSGSGDRGRGERRSERTSHAATDRPGEPVDSRAARGEGRPALRRPLRIDHLP